MIQCEEAHVICQECAIAGARTAFENLDPSLPCLAVGDCNSHYPPDEAKKFLNGTQWARWETLRRDADVAILAAAENLKRCPWCPFVLFCLPNDSQLTPCIL